MRLRAVLLVTVFFSGAALMSLEMAGFRLFQPEFGSDIFVWGSLISVFLGGLAAGAYVGGWLADRGPALWKLGAILAAAGLVTLTLPLYSDPVLEWMFPGEGAPLPAEWDEDGASGEELVIYQPPDLRWPTLGAGALLFAAPSILLGMVSPYAARLFIRAMGRLGTGVGKVYGVSTLGSIVGTLATTFYFVGWMGTRQLVFWNGLALIALGALLVAAESASVKKSGD